MKHGLFNALAVVSLALVLGFAALWVRSASWDDYLRYYTRTADTYAEVESVRGRLTVCWWSATSSTAQPSWHASGWSHVSMDLSRYRMSGALPTGGFLGVGTVQMMLSINEPTGPRLAAQTQAVYFPIAYPTILFGAIGGGMLLFAYRRRRIRTTGRCSVCGYDLRATPDRCPECGTAVGASA